MVELEPLVEGTRVRVVESSPDLAPALELRSLALEAAALALEAAPAWTAAAAA